MTSVPDTGPTTETRRRPTPKPNHREAKVLHRADFIPHVWGDSAAGHVTDRVISSTRTLHVLEFELAPGGEFRHSPTNQTIFAGDVLYFVARGEIIVADPSSGHMVRATAGEACFIPPGTWHNGFNPFSTTARVIEFFSPPPLRGAASDYAKHQPPLKDSLFTDPRPAGGRLEVSENAQLRMIAPRDGALHFRGVDPSHLVTTILDTEYLTVGVGEVLSGHVEEFAFVEDESVLYLLEGELWVDIWTELQGYSATGILSVGEAAFLPSGTQQRVLERSGRPARYVFGSARVPDDWSAGD